MTKRMLVRIPPLERCYVLELDTLSSLLSTGSTLEVVLTSLKNVGLDVKHQGQQANELISSKTSGAIYY